MEPQDPFPTGYCWQSGGDQYACEFIHYSQMIVDAVLYAPWGYYSDYSASETYTATVQFPTVTDPGWWSAEAQHYVQVDVYYADCIWPNPWGYCDWQNLHYQGSSYDWIDTTYAQAYIQPPPPPPPPTPIAGNGPHNNPANSGCALCGNPVNAASRAKIQTFVDYEAPGIGFYRTWRSNISDDIAWGGLPTRWLGFMAWGWTHSYASRVVLSGGVPTRLFRPDGSLVDLYQSSPGIHLATDASGIQVRGGGTSTVTVYLPDGSQEVYGYHSCAGLHRLDAVVDAAGSVTNVVYSGGDCTINATSIVGPFGHTLTLNYTDIAIGGGYVDTVLSSVVTPASTQIQYSYVAAGNGTATGQLEYVTYEDSSYVRYHYDDADATGYLSGITDERGIRFATFNYNSSREAIGTVHIGGYGGFTFAYNPDGSATATDAKGHVTSFGMQAFAPAERILGSIVLNGATQTLANETSGQHRLLSTTDARGFTTNFGYDAYHQTSMTEALGTGLARTTTFSYLNDTSQLVTVAQSPSACTIGTLYRTVATTYVSGTQRVQSVAESGYGLQGGACQPVSRTTSFEYATTFAQTHGLPTAIRGPRPGVADDVTLAYYECTGGSYCGQLSSVTNAAGHVTTFNSYNAHGLLTQTTDPNGVVTTFAYDSRRRLTGMTETPPAGPARVTAYTYNPAGMVATVTAPNGTVLTHAYDSARNLTSVTDNAGNWIQYGYDLAGNRTSENVYDASSTLRKTVQTAYDARNFVDWINSAGSVTDLAFDALGNLTNELDPGSNPTTHVYDALNRLSQTTNALSGVTTIGYDRNDRVSSVTAPNGAATAYVYDDLGNLRSVTSPDSGTTSFVTDAAGNVTSETDANGVVVNTSFDALNRPTFIDYPGTGLDVTLTYDQGSAQKGRLTTMTDGSGTTTLVYDYFGNVVQESKSVAGTNHVTSYAWDAADLLTSITYPSGLSVSYARNSLGQVTSVSGNYGGGFTLASGASYRPFGPLTGLTFGNGRVLGRSFDQQYRLTAQTTTSVQNLAFGLDAAGNVDAITDYVYGLNQSFGQDALHRITSESGGYGSKGYTFDANGNRTSQTGATPQSLSYAANTNRQATQNGLALTLDAAGNTLANPAENLSFSYGSHNRMLNAYVGGVLKGTYTYNGRGQRIRKVEAPSAGGRMLVYHYGPDGNLLGETIYDSGGAKIGERDYVWIGSLPIAQIERTFSGGVLQGSQLVYLHADHLNTPRLATNAAGTVVWRWDSDAFGVGNANLDPDGDTNQVNVRLRFPGQYRDDETGLNYNYFRDYDPVTGRYTQFDPIGLGGGANPYLYADGNSTRSTDPSGLWPTPDTIFDVGSVIYDLYRIGKDNVFGDEGNLGENLGALCADLGGLVTPIATGGGTAVRVANKVDDAVAVASGVRKLTGQMHHGISRRIHEALEQHPNLRGVYEARDPRFVTQGQNAYSHRGYQDWHRRLDAEIGDWIRGNPNATREQFESYLRGVYQRPEVLERFPNGL